MSRNLVCRTNASQSEEWKQPSPNMGKKPVMAVDSSVPNDSERMKELGSNMSDTEEKIVSDTDNELKPSHHGDANLGSSTENETSATGNCETHPSSSFPTSENDVNAKTAVEMKKRLNKTNQTAEQTVGCKKTARRRRRNKVRLTLKRRVNQKIRKTLSGAVHGELGVKGKMPDGAQIAESKQSSQSKDPAKTVNNSDSVRATLDEVIRSSNSVKNHPNGSMTKTSNEDAKSSSMDTQPNMKADTEKSTDISSSSDPEKRAALRKPKPCKPTEVLSHYQILKKCLSQEILYHVLQIGPKMYKCPLCPYQNALGQYVMLHLRRHRDLTAIFEKYQKAGILFKDEVSSSELPEQNSFVINSKNSSSDSMMRPLLMNSTAPFTGEKASDKDLVKKKKKRAAVVKKVATSRLLAKRAKKLCIARKRPEVSSCSTVVNPMPECSVTVSDAVSVTGADRVVPSVDHISSIEKLSSAKKSVTKRKLPCGARPVKKNVEIKTPKQSPNDVNSNLKKTSPLFGVSYRESLDPELLRILKQDIRRKVSPDNPHTCRFCGKLFLKGTGIYSHYFKHARKPVGKKTMLKKQLGNPQHGNSALNSLVSNPNAEKGLKAVLNKDDLTLVKLEKNINQLLKILVGNNETLSDLGWPERNVGDLLIDILEISKVQPAYCDSDKLSKLECLRKNVIKLFHFCIHDNAMEEYGWNNKIADEVVKEVLLKENCEVA